jgi:hypothetical protein
MLTHGDNVVTFPTAVQPGDFARVVIDVSDVGVLEEREFTTKVQACASASVEASQDITIEVARVIAEALRFVATKIEDRAAEQDGDQVLD